MAPKTNGTPAKAINYLAIRPLLVNVKSHGDTDEQVRERKVAHCEPFIPNKDLESFVTEKNVEATLDELLGHDEYNKDLTDYIVKKAPKTFLTCIYIGAEYLKRQACIEILRKADFTDENLPIRTVMVKDAKDGDEPYEVCANGSDDPLACFSKWGARLQAEYEEKQWIFLAPTFKERVFSYEFHQNEQMPFVYLPNPNPAGGFFGKVLKLGLHEDHQSLPSFHLKRKPNARYTEVAVKFMSTESNVPNSDVDKFYDREKTTLELMRKLKDDHLIRAIAAYKKGTSRCFIFPWAEGGNLDTFWRNDRSGLDEYLVRWAIDQMTGLTGGIMKLHAKGTRHGDIKPFNILYFLDQVDDHGRGTLKIADVGLAKVHTEYTKYRDPTTTRMSTERYEPPEMMRYIKREAAIPRVYDSWSLGCVFLEFIVWLLYGETKLRDFHRDLKDSNQEKFYETKGNSHPRHYVVNKLIKEMEESFSDFVTFGRLIRLISEHLLVPVHKRMETRILYEEMDDIRRNSQQDSYSGLAGVPRLRPVPNDGPQPPDKHTSKLDNRWRNNPDSEWARILISRLDFNSLRPTVQTGFCDACNSIDFLDNSSDGIDLGRTLQSYKEGSGSCSMCRFLFQCLSSVPTGTSKPVFDELRLSLPQGNDARVSFYVDPDYKGPAPIHAQLGLPVLPSLGSPQQFALLNEWITLCDNTHKCVLQEPYEDCHGKMPTRLIHVGTADHPALYLVDTKHVKTTWKYIALSHCWGRLSKEERFCTYSDNIQDLKQHIPFEKLPQTFKDAVTATRALNVRYLWIDSLCIIQEDAEDWKIEAARMEDVFNSAYCTIAASSSSSSLDGFLASRKERAVIGINTRKGPLFLAEAIDDFRKDVEQGILNTRGWVFQERALSRRTIHFSSTQVYWECGHGVHCETLAHLRNRESELLGDSDFPSYGLQKYKDDSIRLVQYLYRTYSGLNLTHATDRPKAVLGLQSRLGDTFQTEAQYGVLSAYFERLLLWQRDQTLPLEDIPYPEGQAPPSWSWMSVMGKINYLDIPFGKVNWTGDVANPFNDHYDKDEVPWNGGLQVVAHKLAIGEDSLENRVRTDRTYSKMDHEDFVCAVVGTSKLTNDDGTTDQYVLLLRHMSPPCLYERIGVGILLDIHIQPESLPVYVI